MEFLNRNRNPQQYAGDPLAPTVYPADWLFASVMVANPLAWFEVSELPSSDVAALRPLIAIWKRHRAALHGGSILPLGQCPDGAGCSGFLSRFDDGGSAYLIALREPCAPERADWTLPLVGDWNTELLAGGGQITVKNGSAHLRWTAAPDYLFARLVRASS